MVTGTLTSRGIADVNAVNPHVDIIFHVTPLLIIIEHKTSISPQIEPVPLPPTKNGAFNVRCATVIFVTNYIHRFKVAVSLPSGWKRILATVRVMMYGYSLWRWSQPLFTIAMLETMSTRIKKYKYTLGITTCQPNIRLWRGAVIYCKSRQLTQAYWVKFAATVPKPKIEKIERVEKMWSITYPRLLKVVSQMSMPGLSFFRAWPIWKLLSS